MLSVLSTRNFDLAEDYAMIFKKNAEQNGVRQSAKFKSLFAHPAVDCNFTNSLTGLKIHVECGC